MVALLKRSDMKILFPLFSPGYQLPSATQLQSLRPGKEKEPLGWNFTGLLFTALIKARKDKEEMDHINTTAIVFKEE